MKQHRGAPAQHGAGGRGQPFRAAAASVRCRALKARGAKCDARGAQTRITACHKKMPGSFLLFKGLA